MSGHVCTCEECHPEAFKDTCKYEAAVREAVHLLDNAKCDYLDPSLRRRWGERRKALRRVVA